MIAPSQSTENVLDSNRPKLNWLSQIRLFQNLTDAEIDYLLRYSVLKRKTKGEHLYYPNEHANTVFFLISGRVKVGSTFSDGKEYIKGIVQPGEMFGEMGMVGQALRTDFAVALEDEVSICTLNVDDFLKLIRNNAELSIKITNAIGAKLIQVERRFESLLFKDARTRIVDIIREMALERGQVLAGGSILISHALTHQDIASITATSRQTVTTVLNELKELNVINFDRKSILVHEMKTLI